MDRHEGATFQTLLETVEDFVAGRKKKCSMARTQPTLSFCRYLGRNAGVNQPSYSIHLSKYLSAWPIAAPLPRSGRA